jgi:hypothetical protein
MSTKAKWTNKVLTHYESSSQEMVRRAAPLVFYDDFIHAYTSVSIVAESGFAWTKSITGTTTVGMVAGANGLVELATSATEEAQVAVLYASDRLLYNLRYGLIFEARVKLSVLPTSGTKAVWGLAGALGAFDDIAYNCWFTADGSGLVKCESDDNATDNDDKTSGVTVLATDWKIYRIDATDYSNIKFSINGTNVATATTFAWAATEGNSVVQPFFGLSKGVATSIGTMVVDSVKIWTNRA